MSETHQSSEVSTVKNPGSWVSTGVAVLSLLVAIIALIPAFSSLQKNEPRIQYAVLRKTIEAPDPIDDKLFSKFLFDNGIPSETISVQIKNTGKAPSKIIKISVDTQASIVRYGWKPPASTKPIWVELEEGKDLGMDSGLTEVKVEAKNLAPEKLLEQIVGYKGNGSKSSTVEVFSDGISGARVSDISQAKVDSAFKPFELPLIILGVGFLLTVLSVFVRLVLRSEEYRTLVARVAKNVFRGVLESLLPFRW